MICEQLFKQMGYVETPGMTEILQSAGRLGIPSNVPISSNTGHHQLRTVKT